MVNGSKQSSLLAKLLFFSRYLKKTKVSILYQWFITHITQLSLNFLFILVGYLHSLLAQKPIADSAQESLQLRTLFFSLRGTNPNITNYDLFSVCLPSTGCEFTTDASRLVWLSKLSWTMLKGCHHTPLFVNEYLCCGNVRFTTLDIILILPPSLLLWYSHIHVSRLVCLFWHIKQS